MRTAFAILLVIGILASPIGCFASCPRHNHECCERPTATAICPYDILAAAKAALPAIPAVRVESVAAVLLAIRPPAFVTRVLDGAELHLSNCVLRV